MKSCVTTKPRAEFLALLVPVTVVCLSALMLWSTPARSQNGAIRPTRSFGNMLYAVPTGYQAIGTSDGVLMARRSDVDSGNISGIIAVPREIRADAKLLSALRRKSKAEIAQALVVGAANLQQDPAARISPATLVNDVARDRYEAYRVVTISKDSGAGKTRYSVMFVLFPGNFIHIVSANGFGSEKALDAITPGLNALLASIEFRNMGARVPPSPQPSLPTRFATPSAPQAAAVQTLRGRPTPPSPSNGGSCRIVQRQMCSGGFASGMGYFCNTYPQRVCD